MEIRSKLSDHSAEFVRNVAAKMRVKNGVAVDLILDQISRSGDFKVSFNIPSGRVATKSKLVTAQPTAPFIDHDDDECPI